MTLILKRSNLAEDFITGGQDNIGLRVPNHSVALALLNEFEKVGGHGIAAPSANRFGAVSPTIAGDVIEELSEYLNSTDLILDGGQCTIGLESTIIDCTGLVPIILRPGAITADMISDSLNIFGINFDEKSNIRVPGKLESHYSPKALVFIDLPPNPGDGFIAMHNIPTPSGVIRLASPITIEEYAKNFYKALRLGDKKGLKRVSVLQPKGSGIAEAIRDRLSKASNK
jgi:L-threonylcarbamoyladenylate synthase